MPSPLYPASIRKGVNVVVVLLIPSSSVPAVLSDISTLAIASPSAPDDVTLNSPLTVYCLPVCSPLTLAPAVNVPALPCLDALIVNTPPVIVREFES